MVCSSYILALLAFEPVQRRLFDLWDKRVDVWKVVDEIGPIELL